MDEKRYPHPRKHPTHSLTPTPTRGPGWGGGALALGGVRGEGGAKTDQYIVFLYLRRDDPKLHKYLGSHC